MGQIDTAIRNQEKKIQAKRESIKRWKAMEQTPSIRAHITRAERDIGAIEATIRKLRERKITR